MTAPATRRAFLTSAALTSAHLALRRPTLAQKPGQVPGQPPARTPRQRLAVATYPFRARIVAPGNTERDPKLPGLDLPAFARYIRSEFHLSAIEPLHAHFPATDPASIRAVKAAFDAAGIRTSNIPVDEDVDLTSPDPARRAASYRTLERWIDIAVTLRSPSIRIGSVPHGAGPADIAGPAAALQPLLRYASARNVVILLENDDPVFGTASRITAILQAAHSPSLRALPDFANSLMGGDENFNAEAVRSMFRFAANVCHVKDAELIKHQHRTVSLQQLFLIARDAHYTGDFSLESDSEAEPAADTRHLIEQSLALI